MLDVLVVGGGIIGLFTALECRQRGMTVALVDAREERPSASWAGGGILSPLFPWRVDPGWRPLVSQAMVRYQSWANTLQHELGVLPEINPCGMLVAEPDPESAIQWGQAQGEKVVRTVERGLPQPFSERASLWMPEVGAVRNPEWLTALRSLCRQRGVAVMDACVEALTEVDGCVEVVMTGTTLRVAHAVVAAGYWSRILLQQNGVAETVLPVKGEMLLYRVSPGDVPAILLADEGYLIPRKDGLVLAGSTLEVGNQDMRPGEKANVSLSQLAATWHPPLNGIQPIAQWAGIRPGSTRPLPLIGAVEPASRLLVATGHYRNGLVSAPATGALVAQLLAGEKPFCDPLPYSPLS